MPSTWSSWRCAPGCSRWQRCARCTDTSHRSSATPSTVLLERIDRGERFADALPELSARLGPAVDTLVDGFAAADRDGLPLAPVLERLAADARASAGDDATRWPASCPCGSPSPSCCARCRRSCCSPWCRCCSPRSPRSIAEPHADHISEDNMNDRLARLHAWYLWHTAVFADEDGQATTEYALVLLAAALVALMAVAWATTGGGSGKVGTCSTASSTP